MKYKFSIVNFEKENVETGFMLLFYDLIASINYHEYCEQKEKFQKCFEILNIEFAKYLKNYSLDSIDYNIMEGLYYDLMDLNYETEYYGAFYAEWAYLHIEDIINLMKNYYRYKEK